MENILIEKQDAIAIVTINRPTKLNDYTQTILQQIDTMSSVASAFSNFATMPAQQNETLNVVRIVKMALEIFNEDYIQFSALEDEIIAKLDRTQLIRVITNLVKNAIQSIPEEQEHKLVFVTVFREDNQVKIAVKDNGKGISEENLTLPHQMSNKNSTNIPKP